MNSKSPFYEFLQDFIEDKKYESDHIIKIKPVDFNEKWKCYCCETNIKNGENGKTIKNKLLIMDINVYGRELDDDNSSVRLFLLNKDKIINYLKKHNYYENK